MHVYEFLFLSVCNSAFSDDLIRDCSMHLPETFDASSSHCSLRLPVTVRCIFQSLFDASSVTFLCVLVCFLFLPDFTFTSSDLYTPQINLCYCTLEFDGASSGNSGKSGETGNEFAGNWKVNNLNLRDLRNEALDLKDNFKSDSVQHIPKGSNREADAQASWGKNLEVGQIQEDYYYY
ncbi:unnamed protein product [Vicia faba]|uniref:Uncharacterized protein n=1 Tax=Vicia faba TaxID=3906 RepID=A0AAV1B4W3_VICFA|nr:unnamed protein product [Vicia faba]